MARTGYGAPNVLPALRRPANGDRTAFERDRARDAHLQRLVFRVLRFTHRQLIHYRSTVVAGLRELLSQRSLAPNL